MNNCYNTLTSGRKTVNDDRNIIIKTSKTNKQILTLNI